MSEQARALYQRWKEQHASSRSGSGQPRQQPGRPPLQPRATAAGRGTAPHRLVQGTDVVLGTEEVTGAPVLLPYARRPEHLTIVGSTGTGKTTLLERLVRQDIVDGTACVVFDVHGDMTDNLLRFAASQPAWAARTLLVDLIGDDPPFGANLYECPDLALRNTKLVERTVAGVLTYLMRFWGEDLNTRAVIARGLLNTTRTIIANPGYTMVEVPLLFSDQALRARLLARVRNPLVHAYWQAYDKLSRESERELWRDSLDNKLEQFLENEVTYPVLSQERSTIPWDEILNGGYCLLIRLPLLAGEQSMEYLNTLLVNQLSRQLAARAGTTDVEHRPRVHLYLDEYRRLASEQTSTLLYEARKANVGVTVAMQSLADLESDVGRNAVLQTATRLAFRTTAAVAKVVAIGFAPPPRQVAVKKGICQTPVDYLVSHTHPNPTVRALAQQVLAPLADELGQRRHVRSIQLDEYTRDTGHQTALIGQAGLAQVQDYTGASHRSRQTSSIDTTAVALIQAKQQLTGLLVEVMEGRLQPGEGSLVDRITQAFFHRFDHLPEGLRVYIAVTTLAELLTPGSYAARYVGDLFTTHYLTATAQARSREKDFASFCLEGQKVFLSLLTAKEGGLAGAQVRAGEQEVAALQRARAREKIGKDIADWRRKHPLPTYGFYSFLEGHNLARAISQVADLAAEGNPLYTRYLARFERSKFVPQALRDPATEVMAKERAEANKSPAAAAFLDQFGESALVMGWLWDLTSNLIQCIEFGHDCLSDFRKTWYAVPYLSNHDVPISRDERSFRCWRHCALLLPLVTGYPLAPSILILSDLATHRIRNRLPGIREKGQCRIWGYREEDADVYEAAVRDGWRPLPVFPEPWESHREHASIMELYEQIAAVRRGIQERVSRDRQPDLIGRLLLYKAHLAMYHQEYADRVLPDDSICPPGQWPNTSETTPSRRRRFGNAGTVTALVTIVQELRELLEQLDIEKERLTWLPREEELNSSEDYQTVHISLVPSQAQAAVLREHFRRTLTGTTDEELLRRGHRDAFAFISGIHRLCELLAREPIEVSAGPQEERQQTTADVVNEVERQLTQLDNGKAYHALLQEDGTINADKITLLPPPARSPDNPQVVDQIRQRSRQRFSRPRAEIDAATARRQDTTAGPAASPPPHQTPPPGARTRPPPPDPGLPPIGRR